MDMLFLKTTQETQKKLDTGRDQIREICQI